MFDENLNILLKEEFNKINVELTVLNELNLFTKHKFDFISLITNYVENLKGIYEYIVFNDQMNFELFRDISNMKNIEQMFNLNEINVLKKIVFVRNNWKVFADLKDSFSDIIITTEKGLANESNSLELIFLLLLSSIFIFNKILFFLVFLRYFTIKTKILRILNMLNNDDIRKRISETNFFITYLNRIIHDDALFSKISNSILSKELSTKYNNDLSVELESKNENLKLSNFNNNNNNDKDNSNTKKLESMNEKIKIKLNQNLEK